MKILINKTDKNILPITKIYDLGSVTTTINDLLNESTITLEKNITPILSIDGSNYLINNFNSTNIKEDFEAIITESDLIPLGSGNSEPVDSRPYKVYSGLITQTGTNNPVITVLENTLGTVSCTRYDVGRGYFESSGLFVTGKTWLYLNEVHNYAPGGSFNQNIGLIHQINTDFVALESGIISGGVVTSADGIFNNTSFEIRVYN